MVQMLQPEASRRWRWHKAHSVRSEGPGPADFKKPDSVFLLEFRDWHMLCRKLSHFRLCLSTLHICVIDLNF